MIMDSRPPCATLARRWDDMPCLEGDRCVDLAIWTGASKDLLQGADN